MPPPLIYPDGAGHPSSLRTRLQAAEKARDCAIEDSRAARRVLDVLLTRSPAVIYQLRLQPPAMEYISENLLAVLGYAPTCFTEDPGFWLAHVHPDDRDVVIARMRDIPTATHLDTVYRFRHDDGTYRWMRDRATVTRDARGQAAGLAGFWLDITAEREAALTLAASEQQSRALLETLPEAVLVQRDGALLYVNDAAVELFGASSRQALLGHRVETLLFPEDRATICGRHVALLDGAPPERAECRIRRLDGTRVEVESTRAVCLFDGHPATQSILRNITAQKESARALERREQYFRTLLAHASDVISVIDRAGVVTYESPAIERISGFAPEELVGTSVFERVHPDDLPKVRAAFERGMRFGGGTSGEFRHRRKDGSWVVLETVGTPLLEDGVVVGAVINSRDITDRKRAAAERRELAERFRLLVQQADVGIAQLDPDGRIAHANQHMSAIFGVGATELTQFSLQTLLPAATWPQDAAGIAAAAEGRTSGYTVERRCTRPDGSTVWAHFTISFTAIAGAQWGTVIVTDQTAQRDLEEQFRQAQKMEAVGRLAGGVAHDFNNLLTAILGYSELLLEHVPPTHPMHGGLEEIRRAGVSAASLTRQLLAFSRRQVLKTETLDLNVVVSEMSKLLRRTIGDDVLLETYLCDTAARISADRGQIEQVLMNLCVNARDAMPTGGVIAIETECVTLRAPATHTRGHVPPGDYVRLRVTDTGTGMTADTLTHIFEPFFTTKARGKGTGLGLSTVYGIVTQSGGQLAVDTLTNIGTSMFVYLPVSGGTPKTRPVTPTPSPAAGSGLVLIADDDPVVRGYTREVLSGAGYKVLTAASAPEAEAVAARERPVLLITDVVMPGGSGTLLAEQLQRADPSLRILFMSGYLDDALQDHGLPADSAFVQKPFSPNLLLKSVKKALENPRGQA